jgi:hypothetical protein
MEFYTGDSRILFIKVLGDFLPIACLTDNPFSENSEFLDTTTRDNQGWKTSRPLMQSYNISFSGLQVNSSVAGGDFTVASYDKLKELKRNRILLDWKIEGDFPVVDYGKAYINDLSEATPAGEFLTFNGSLIGYGKPLTTTKDIDVLNSGNPLEVIVTDTNANKIIRTKD